MGLLAQLTPEQLEILKVCFGYSLVLMGAGWLFHTLTWVRPTLLSFTRKVWADDKTDTTVKVVTSAFPLCLDTLPAWAGAIAGGFLADEGMSTWLVAGACGLATALITYLVGGIRWKETLAQSVSKVLEETHRAGLALSRGHEETRADLATLAKRYERQDVGTKVVAQAVEKLSALHDMTLSEVSSLRSAITGEEKEALKTILGLDIEKTLDKFRQEVNTILSGQRKRMEEEIQKCFGVVSHLVPGSPGQSSCSNQRNKTTTGVRGWDVDSPKILG